MSEDDETHVWISETEIEDAARALATPAFIVKVGQVFYVTKAVWEYDATKAATDEQEAGCALIRDLFNETVGEEGLFACPILTAGVGGDISQTGD